MTNIHRVLALSYAEKYSSFLIGLVSTMILARLLTPAEIGLFSVAASVVALAHTLRHFGVGQYLIKAESLTREKVENAYGVTMLLAWCLAGIVYLISAPIADFYGQPGIGTVMKLLAVNFLFLPMSSTLLALLSREMNFAARYWIQIGSSLLALVTSVTMAAHGFGYMALAWATVVNTVATVAIANCFRPALAPWRPRLRQSGEVLSFGGIIAGGKILEQIGGKAPELIVGSALGMAPVAILSKARALIIDLFMRSIQQGLSGIILPHLSQLKRQGSNTAELKRSYVQIISLLSVTAWPAAVFLSCTAFPIVRILYGDQWDAVVPLVPIVAVGFSIGVLSQFSMQILITLDLERKYLKLQSIKQFSLVAFVLASASYGLAYVALSIALVAMIELVYYYSMLRKYLNLRFHEMWAGCYKSLMISVLSAVGPVVVFLCSGPFSLGILSWLLLSSGSAAIGWLAGIIWLDHPMRRQLNKLIAEIPFLRRVWTAVSGH